ncbi:MAG TPA: CTP synthase (glutamine hydrolyzing) [Thermoplasmata archaeon]|nr:CTP synthase (glutamine hydrolyzing) [Thermoplasmata archaeon]
MNYIVITGGVLSGLGKGITASSIGMLLKACGYKVTAIKIDPYLNCDAGTMNPFQHGEVFVLEDGTEVDLDLGNYERFLNENLTKHHNITTGKVYKSVIEKERRGEYLGATVQIIPHVTNEIRRNIKMAAETSEAEIAIVELGGTVGDIESMPFLEAVRQLHIEVGHENLIFIHTTLVPVIGVVGEQKTKPTQHSVKALREIGILPDMMVCRADDYLEDKIKEKISLFCDVPKEAVLSAPNARTIYEVPLILEKQGITSYILNKLNLKYTKTIQKRQQKNLKNWKEFVNNILYPEKEVTVAIVGKYTDLKDSYICVVEAVIHAGAALKTKVNIKWVDSEKFEKNPNLSVFEDIHGLIVPGGFGKRGTEGKIRTIQYVRENNIPFIGLCLGFQLAVVEYARNAIGLKDANSTEFDPDTEHKVIGILPELYNIDDLGGTMRLGAQEVLIKEGSLAHRIYGKTVIYERHRHRYEVNPKLIDLLESKDLKFTGRTRDGLRMEILEIPTHRYFIASQFHPEFKSRPNAPAPMFYHLVKNALKYKKEKKK